MATQTIGSLKVHEVLKRPSPRFGSNVYSGWKMASVAAEIMANMTGCRCIVKSAGGLLFRVVRLTPEGKEERE